MGCGENQMSAGYAYNNERLEIYPSAQGVKFMVIKKWTYSMVFILNILNLIAKVPECPVRNV